MTSVSDAIDKRMSVRAFLPKEVPQNIIEEILTKSARSPSGGNVQPWFVDVLTGDKLLEFKKLAAQKVAADDFEETQYKIYPDNLWEPHKSYRFGVGEDMYNLLEIPREDKAGRQRQFVSNYRFFDAPVALFFSFDKRVNEPQWSDTGMFMQTIMLLAIEYGLDTCAQECWARLANTISEFLGYDENRFFFCGMAMGYRDNDAKINQLRSKRAPLEAFVKFHK